MSRLWLVKRKELRMTALTKSCLIATLSSPFIIALVALPTLLAQSALEGISLAGRTLVLVGVGELPPAIRAELAPLGMVVTVAGEEAPLADRVRAGDLDGYVVFPADVRSVRRSPATSAARR